VTTQHEDNHEHGDCKQKKYIHKQFFLSVA